MKPYQERQGKEASARHLQEGGRIKSRVARVSYGQDLLARLSMDPREARVVCECNDVLIGEILVALGEGKGFAEILHLTGIGRGGCHGLRCLVPTALLVAMESGESPAKLREQALALLAQKHLASSQSSFFGAFIAQLRRKE
ncbi:MAG: hypothetical protein NZM37_11790 [Sandaracinaceae bacterium]|nr:hypothetical protein [Sandaracinaceae bacterium]MDW8247581.1 hypothetical protein [Sandaracinaceae bacterium]